MNRWVAAIGIVMAIWMTLGRWAFGLGGSFTWWYVPAIGATFVWLQLWAARRIRLARERGRRTSRRTVVCLILAWLSAVAFGLTVPDRVDGELVTLLSEMAGPGWLEMAIALCNPFGIIAFALTIAAIAFAAADGRDPKPEEDEIYTANGDAPRMVAHPLE